MRKETVHHLKVIGVILGGILTHIPLGVAYYYGNLSTYTDSYFIRSVGKENHTTGTMWMVTAWASVTSIGVLLSGIISKIIGLRLTLLMGMLMINLGLYTSFFTLDSSFWSLHITLGVMTGMGTGFCYATVLLYTALWVKQRTGFASAIVSSAAGGGSFIFNLVATIYINPENRKPDIFVGESKYFSQDEIINRVPYVFLVLGAMTTGCHIVGFSLIRDHPDFVKHNAKKISTNNIVLIDKSRGNTISRDTHNIEQYGATDSIDMTVMNSDKHEKCVSDNIEAGQSNRSITSAEQTQVSRFIPLEALRNKTLYILGISLALMIIGFVVENSAYKQFGVLYFNDDYFLANIGVGVSIVVFLSRIIWGIAIDKSDIKHALMYAASVHSIIAVFWFFTPLVDKWFYFVCTLAIQATQSGSYIIYPMAVLRFYGHEHYMVIYGMMAIFCMATYFITPALAQVIIANLGWYWLFFFVSAASFLALILVLFLPKDPKP